MAKILVVEDDLPLCRVIDDWLKHNHHLVECVHTGREAQHFLNAYRYDIIILDWGLPDIDGIDLCRNFRKTGGQTPILMLTGRKTVAEKEAGLDSGADDYLTKPFDVKELSARVRALLRRPPALSDNALQARDLVLDPSAHTVTKNGIELSVFPKEFALLEFLMRHPNKVFSAEALLDHVWHCEAGVGPEAVRASVKRLRKQIDTDGQPSLIENVHGVGYKLILE